MAKLNPIVRIFMTRDEMSHQEARELLQEMRQQVAAGEDPEEVLYENGLEPDYIYNLLP